MVQNNISQQQKALIYRLTRQFGGSLSIYKLLNTSTNLIDGSSVVNYQITKVRRAIIMMPKEVRLFGKGFKFGDAYDEKSRIFVIERRLLKGYEPDLNDVILHKNQKYSLKSIREPENDRTLIIEGVAVEGQLPEETHSAVLNNNVNLDSSNVKS